MIERMSHATIYVVDQDESLEFYRDKLGFEVRTDVSMDNGFRWLTVGPKGQTDLEIVLMELKPSPMLTEEAVVSLKSLIEQGAMGTGVFSTSDCQATYEEMKANGVEFMQPPTDRFYGVEALFKDNSGNWFSMTQPK